MKLEIKKSNELPLFHKQCKMFRADPVAAEQAVKQLTSFDPVDAMKMTTIAIESLGKWD